jgi:hypothetical protein
MAAAVQDFRVVYHYEIGGKPVTGQYVDHVQLAGRVLAEDPAYAGKKYTHPPTVDAINTVLNANGRGYPGGTRVFECIAVETTATDLLA